MKKIGSPAQETLKKHAATADREIARYLKQRAKGPSSEIYQMMRYFMGYVDTKGRTEKKQVGKRFRPGLCLLIADLYGTKARALPAAVAIELFHNFTLIHDDIEDNDEMRRGRPTVWKVWGIPHAINSGDGQLLLAAQWAQRVSDDNNESGKQLLEAFLEVVEGQYLDFELAAAPIPHVDEKRYLQMIEKKSGVLVGVAAEMGGIAARKNAKECALLRTYGLSLGTAFQIADDYASIWSPSTKTGKDAYSDIREHKRTLPFLRAYEQSKGNAKRRLKKLYSKEGQLTRREIREVRTIIDETDASAYVLVRIREYTSQAKKAALSLSIPKEKQTLLLGIIELLIPVIQTRDIS